MDEVGVPYLGLPHVYNDRRYDGFEAAWPRRCRECDDRECERSASSGVQTCRFGINFIRLGPSLLAAGFIVSDLPEGHVSDARRKMLRKGDSVRLNKLTVEDITSHWAAVHQTVERNADKEVRSQIEAERASTGYAERLLEHLRPEIQLALGQVHDYRQLVTQIIQNLNVIADRRAPGIRVEETLSKGSFEEMAVYRAARMMEMKLNAALFFVAPERIDAPGSMQFVRIHGLFTTHRKIYARAFETKGLKVALTGESYGESYGNPEAFAVILQTFIDNALKYAPKNSEVEFRFTEDASAITFAARSYGPDIGADEIPSIYEPFYRGRRAREASSEGTGFGLALSRLVADRCGIVLAVQQDPGRSGDGWVWTEFGARFPRTQRPGPDQDTRGRLLRRRQG